MKSFWMIATALLLIVACKSRRVPEGVIKPEKMEAIMWDMIQAGEFLNGYVLFRDTTTNQVLESQRWYDKIYSLHNTSREEFIRSYEYYRTHPRLMQEVFDSMAVYEDRLAAADSTAVTDTFGQKQRRRPEFNAGEVELKPM
jgi:hypothetical protein